MTQSPASLPFDRDAALANLGGDESLLAEIARLFVAEWPQNLDRMRAALAAGDAVALRRAAHTVKGSVANFEAARAVEAARELEYAGRDERLDLAPQLLEATVASVEAVVAALKAETDA